MGRWLCFSACNLKKDYLVLCLLCLLIGIETDMGTEEETGVRQQKDSRIRQEETGRKIKKRRETRGEEGSWRFVFLLIAGILLLSSSSCSLLYPLCCLLLCPRKRRMKKGYVLLPVTLPAGCQGAIPNPPSRPLGACRPALPAFRGQGPLVCCRGKSVVRRDLSGWRDQVRI